MRGMESQLPREEPWSSVEGHGRPRGDFAGRLLEDKYSDFILDMKINSWNIELTQAILIKYHDDIDP